MAGGRVLGLKSKQEPFKRKLSLIDVTFIGLGAMIGSSWMFAPQTAVQLAGPAALLSWVIAAIVLGMLALVYAELGGALPSAGGFIRYPNYSHGDLVGFIISCMSFITYSVSASLEVVAIRTYLSAWWPSLGSHNPTVLGWLIQLFLLITFFLINYWSVNVFGKINSVVTIIKFAVPVLTIIVLLNYFTPSNFYVDGFLTNGFGGVESAIATAGIAYAFIGFQQTINFSAEAKNPGRTIPIATMLSIGLAGLLYFLLQFAYIGAIPGHLLENGWAGLSLGSPFADLTALLGLMWLMNLLMADAILSPGGAANVGFGATARIIYAWAKNKTFFKIFTNVDEKTGVPRVALWFTFILAVFWTLPFPSWEALVSVAASSAIMAFITGPISAAAFRITAPDLHRPFKLKGFAVIAPIAFIISSFIIYWSGWKTISWLFAFELFLFVAYIVVWKGKRKSQTILRKQMKTAWWLVFYNVSMFILSWLGTFGGNGWIPAPWDQILVALLSVVTYYWGAKSAMPNPVFDTDHVHIVDKSDLSISNRTT